MIRVLPAEVINQIAAGEVIERPFSVVKELVENSLDAGARRIQVVLEDGGKELIRVLDDGAGMASEDLALAFASHATSKLSALADLDHIASLGFRGEALASIGSVSRASVRSRQKGGEGAEVRAEGRQVGPPRPASAAPGTQVEVRDLFFNTPARRRFLRTARAERAKIQELLQRLALARLDVAFELEAEGKRVLQLPADETLQQRMGRVFGKGVGDHLLPVALSWDQHRVEGLVGDPDLGRRDSSLELLYVNGRLCRDRGATHALRQAYREYQMPARFPVYCLQLSLPPDQVDVNVHPSKAEVRFLDGRRVCGLLFRAASQGLAQRGVDGRGDGVLDGGQRDKPRARSGFPALPADLFGRSDQPAAPLGPPGARSEPDLAPTQVRQDGPMEERVAEPATEVRESANPFARLRPQRFLQVMDLYVVCEGDDGMVVVDQHALHERILYERLQRAHREGKPAVQKLLVPVVVELGVSEKAWLLDARDALAAEGLEVEDFGGDHLAIQAVPALLEGIEPRRLLESLLAGAEDEQGLPRAADAIVERLHSRSCRGAIMSGDRLREEEMAALLEEAATLEHPHNCPHGRPTVLTFTAAELERFFRRRV